MAVTAAPARGFSKTREAGSRLATQLSGLVTGKALSDPMSGFFLMRRDVFDEIAPSLSSEGFKILLDIIVSATRARARHGKELRIGEVPYTFRPRHAGESKMSSIVVVQFLGLRAEQADRRPAADELPAVRPRRRARRLRPHGRAVGSRHLPASISSGPRLSATLVAMTFNFVLNNELTYANKKLRGWRYLTGLLSFYAVCSIGALANVSVASWIYALDRSFWIAGFAGVLMSVVFNYSVTKVFTWR